MTNTTMTKQDWIEAVGRQLARTMPDMYPSGYADFVANDYAEKGGYEAFARGEFRDDLLYDPEVMKRLAVQSS